MTVRTFYRLSLTLPVLVPAALIAALFVAPTLVLWLGNSTSPMALGVLTYSLIYGGAPYVALALWAAWSFGEKTEAQIRRLILTLPLLMEGVAVACFATVAAANGVLGRADTLLTVGFVASIVLGYAYVAIVSVIRRFVSLTEN